MGKIVQRDNETVYQQDDGEITAWLTGFEEKMALEHKGARSYRHVVHLLVAVGVLYLAVLYVML